MVGLDNELLGRCMKVFSDANSHSCIRVSTLGVLARVSLPNDKSREDKYSSNDA